MRPSKAVTASVTMPAAMIDILSTAFLSGRSMYPERHWVSIPVEDSSMTSTPTSFFRIPSLMKVLRDAS